ncbi:carboxy terminal-processing peptidase [Dasania marina]|uniref:carboxy terminal-processing peptidase n=1 Tax=Dasania marina TaxID=471499 RepID=UPI00038270C7|nr:carboxy terminal-processing peptidase [Dasania marina]
MSLVSRIHTRFTSLNTLAFLLCLSGSSVLAEEANIPTLAPTAEQAKTTKEITLKLAYMHYASKPLDDHISSQFFDNYLQRLDGAKTFFLTSDIAEFEPKRLQLDDELKRGELTTGYSIYNRFQQRVLERINTIQQQLPSLIDSLDLNREETLLIDRSEQPWPDSTAAADDLWRKLLKSRIVSMQLDDKTNPEIIKLLSKRYQNQYNRIQQSNAEDVFQIYINSLTELYDPHTNYLSPRSSENFNINMSLSLQGIGAVLQQEDEYTKVMRLVPAGPAFKQGALQPSDRIVGVAQGDEELVDVIGMRLDEVVDLIRGPKDSIVHLEVIPVTAKTDDERKLIKIRRDTVKLEEQSAQRKMLNLMHEGKMHKLGVVDLPTFYRNFAVRDVNHPDFRSTSYDVMKHVTALQAEGAEGIIIDLRDNGGGSLDEANALTSLFIEAGATVQIRHSNGKVDRAGKNYRSKYFDMPVVVLINRLSASASEIFAGAMQDYKRALIIGSPSFGKGTVQSINDLTQGQLKITESKFYRVSGESTQHRGVVPDILFPELYDSEKVGESSLEHALPWDSIAAMKLRHYYNFEQAMPVLKTQHQQRIANDPDFVFMNDRRKLAEDAKQLTHLPLNKAARKALEDDESDKLLAIENKRRKFKGLTLITDLDELKEEDSKEQAEKTAANEPANAIDENDPLLNEAGKILLDAMPYQKSQQVAKRPGYAPSI